MASALVLALQPVMVWLLLFPRPGAAFLNFLVLWPFLPAYMGLRLGGFGITAARCALLYLLLGTALREPRRFQIRLQVHDLLFGAFLCLYLALTGLRGGESSGAQYAFGKFMDIGVPYLLVRMFVCEGEDLFRFLKRLMLPAVGVIPLAIVQSATGFNPFTSVKQGAEELAFGAFNESMTRNGLFRADVGLTHFIMLGVWFAMLLPLAHAWLRGIGMGSGRCALRLAALALGLCCSVSGGSMLAAAAAMGFVFLWPLRRCWILILACVALTLGFVETFSNRHFWVVIASRAATDAASAWYRVYAPEVWIERFLPGHWVWGHGRDLPDMGVYSDITNHYFLIIFHGGLVTLSFFFATVISAFAGLRRAALLAWTPWLRRVCWAVAASLIGLLLVMFTVSLFGQMVGYLSAMLALPAALRAIAWREQGQMAVWTSPAMLDLVRRSVLRLSGRGPGTAETGSEAVASAP